MNEYKVTIAANLDEAERKTYAILYYAFNGAVDVLTVPGSNSEDAKNYAIAIGYYSNLIDEKNIIKVVKI